MPTTDNNKMPKSDLSRTVGPVLVGLVAVPAMAVDLTDELTEEDYLQSLPMVMSATRLPQSIADTPASITVLDRALIDASGFTEIGDLFRLVPGFQVGLAWRDHHTAATYHGQTDGLSRRMQVLVDGRTAFTSQFGLTSWDHLGITVQDIERIEVVRGPASAAYGSNAFVAAINIVTRQPPMISKVEAYATVGSAGTELLGMRYRHQGERLTYTAAANYLDTDGFTGGNSEASLFSTRLQGDYQLTANQLLTFELGHSDGPAGRGGNGTLPDPVGTKQVTEQHAVVRFTDAVSSSSEWYLQLAVDRTRRDDRNRVGTVAEVLTANDPTQTPQQQLDNYTAITGITFAGDFLTRDAASGPYDYHANRVDVEAQHTLNLNGQSRLVWGVGYRQNRIKGGLVIKGSDYITDGSGRIYGNWEYRFGDWLYNAGAMLEDGDLVSGELSSRTGVNYRINDRHSLRASFARGWRHPFVGEANHELALKTPDGFTLERFIEVPMALSPERISSWELGYVGGWLGGRLQTEIKIYREQIDNEIQEVFSPCIPALNPGSCELADLFAKGRGQPNGVLNRINGGETDIAGVEGSVDYDFGQGSRLWLSYAYADADQQLPELAVRGVYQHSGTPKHTASALLSHDFSGGWQGSVSYYCLDQMAWFFFGGDTQSYDRVDLRVAKDFELCARRAKLELVGQNLMGGSYSEISPSNQFDSRFYVRFSLQFD